LGRFVVLGVAFLVGYLVANPAGTVWRARYWMPFGNRTAALEHLVEVEPGGAESELSSAIDADDEGLRFVAATVLAKRGDKRGLETLVKLCGTGESAKAKPRAQLEALLDKPERLDDFDSVQEWFDSTRHTLKCTEHAVWRQQGN